MFTTQLYNRHTALTSHVMDIDKKTSTAATLGIPKKENELFCILLSGRRIFLIEV